MRLDRAEGVVLSGNGAVSKGIESGTLAYIGEADETHLQCIARATPLDTLHGLRGFLRGIRRDARL